MMYKDKTRTKTSIRYARENFREKREIIYIYIYMYIYRERERGVKGIERERE